MQFRWRRIVRQPAIAAAALCGIIISNTTDAAQLFFDDFTNGASPAWGNERGAWRALDGTYDASLPSNSPSGPETYSSVTTFPTLKDFTASVTVNDAIQGGLWLRSSFNGGAINGILLVIGGDGGTFDGFYFHEFHNGTFGPELDKILVPGLLGSNMNMRVAVSGDTYSVFVGNSVTPVTTLVDSAFSSGSFGLFDNLPLHGSSPRGITFDNVSISTPGTVTGDPHFTTYDGRHYNMQAVGDFELTRSTVAGDPFDVDIRTRPSQNHGVPVSLISEVGAELGDHRVTFDVDRAKAGESFVWIDGHPASLSVDNSIFLANGGWIIELSPTSYRVIWNTGEILDITNHGYYLDVASSLSPAEGPGSVEGLLGSDSGRNSDFRLPNGTILDPQISLSDIDSVFADAWRVSDATSLFNVGATAVPEPATLTLLGVGLAALGLLRRRAPKPS